jgi:protoheme IX farnesyltransferase
MREDVRTTAIDIRNIAGHPDPSWREWPTLLLQLGRIKISLLATLSAAAGYLLATGRISIHMLAPTAAVFLIACGSCGFNQYQERKIDQLMLRTRLRPIPSGRLNPETALFISLGLILSGFVILLYGANKIALYLGLFAVAWYNGVYTYLKQKTAFAATPGALVGTIPPALGWVTGGGRILDPRIGAIALFFFIWQIPHFWLLLLDSSRDYERTGLPCITKVFSAKQIKRIIFTWLLSTGVSSLIIPLFGLLNSFFSCLLLMAAACWLFLNAVSFLKADFEEAISRAIFTKLNLFILIVLALLSFSKMLAR